MTNVVHIINSSPDILFYLSFQILHRHLVYMYHVYRRQLIQAFGVRDKTFIQLLYVHFICG